MNQHHIDAIRVLRSRYSHLEVGFSDQTDASDNVYTLVCGITSHAPDYNVAIGLGSSDTLQIAQEYALTQALQLAGVMNADGTAITDQVVFVEPLDKDSKLPKELTGERPGATGLPPTDTSSTGAMGPTTSSSAPTTPSPSPAPPTPVLSQGRQNKVWASAKIFGWNNPSVLDEINRQYGVILTNQLNEEQADAFIDYMSKNRPPGAPS